VNWEKSIYQPADQFMPGIVKWLGFDPGKAVG